MSSDLPPDEKLPGVVPKPPGTRELSVRALISAVLVAALMGASYPYIVLKLGFGPNVSVVAAFFGYLFLGIASLLLSTRSNRWENNIVQTAGTSAAQTAFMCVILAAFDFVGLKPPSVFETFIWLCSASLLGILLAVPLRKHYVEDPDLTFADGVAAAETVAVLDSRGRDARDAAIALFSATAASALVWLLTTHWGAELVNRLFSSSYTTHVLPEVVLATMFGLTSAGTSAGFAVSLLGIGSGMIVGNRVNISMAIGGVISWILLPKLLVFQQADFPTIADALGAAPHAPETIKELLAATLVPIKHAPDTITGIIAEVLGPFMPSAPPPDKLKTMTETLLSPTRRKEILLWAMWPGTGMLIAAGLTSLAIKWRTLARTFSTMSGKAIDTSEFPLKWVGVGVVAATISLLVTEYVIFDLDPWFTFIAVALSVPLMLVGLRVLGETNWGPISQLTNVMQAIFAALVPKNLVANLATSGTTGTIAVQSEAIIQDYKAGHILGSTPRFLTYAQLIAAPIGAIAVAVVYKVLKESYGVGFGDGQLSSPISVRIAGFADVMNRGFGALPDYAMMFLVIGAVVGILIALGEVKWKQYMPSATGLGIGMMVPGSVVFTMVLGGILFSLWQRGDRRSADRIGIPLASGMIAGEALIATVVSILIAAGALSP